MLGFVLIAALNAGPHFDTLMTPAQREGYAELGDLMERARAAGLDGGPLAEAAILEWSLPLVRREFRATRRHAAILVRIGDLLDTTEEFAWAGRAWDEAFALMEAECAGHELRARILLGHAVSQALARLDLARKRRWLECHRQSIQEATPKEPDPERAVAFCLMAGRECKALFGDSHPQYGVILATLAQFQLLRGQYPEAMRSARRAEQILRVVPGEGSEAYAKAVMVIAAAENEFGMKGRAFDTVRRWADWHERHHGRIIVPTAVLASLGWRLGERNNAWAGLRVLRLALAAVEDAPVRDEEARLDTLAPLGILCANEGRLMEASERLEQALALSRKLMRPEVYGHTRLAGVLGGVYYRLGHYRQALPLLREALLILERFGGDPESRANILRVLGKAHLALGEWDKAAECGLAVTALKPAR